MLTLSLEKPGVEAPKKLRLSLNKSALFVATIAWKCTHGHNHDVDFHAFEARNAGDGAKVSALESVLSTFNTDKMNPKAGVLKTNPDGAFATPDGGLKHSGDIRVSGNSETITIDGSRVPEGVNEIPMFVTVYDKHEEASFANIEKAIISISDGNGKELGSYKLSDEFKEFTAVQFGSVILGENGWEYAPVGRGFNGTINDVLGQFS